MREPIFPLPVADVVRTLAELSRHQQQPELVEVLENAHACFEEIDYDNWNGGTYTWALRLQIPVEIFAAIELRVEQLEKNLFAKLAHIDKSYPNDSFGGVSIAPLMAGSSIHGQRMIPSELDVAHLWAEGRFRVFLSHLAQQKIAVSELKSELRNRGVDAFVAHEDIEPSRKWQEEIELALKSMQALVVLATPEFHKSKWTDQEIGWALGRGVFVMPFRLGQDPQGFVGKIQAFSGVLDKPYQLADTIVNALLENAQTRGAMRRAIVHAFINSDSYKMTNTVWRFLKNMSELADDEVSEIKAACKKNGQVRGAFGIPDGVYKKFGKSSVDADDDLPF